MTNIYGFITIPWDTHKVNHNKEILSKLPNIGVLVCRDMFALHDTYNKCISDLCQFIHFAAEYKNEYTMPEDFVIEFECLLSSLYWGLCEVTETWSGLRYTWSSPSEDIQPKRAWQRTIYASYHDLPEIEVVNVGS